MNVRLLFCFGLLVICMPSTCFSKGLLGVVGDLTTATFLKLGLPDYLYYHWKTLFVFADFNKNGTVQKVDFDLAVDEAAKFRPDVSKEKIQEIHDTIVPKAWDAFIAAFPLAKSQGLTLVDMFGGLVIVALRLDKVKAFCDAIFTGCDLDDSGSLDFGEYNLLFQARGIAEEAAQTSFKEADKDNSGNVTTDEIYNCAILYLLGLSESTDTCKDFLGPFAT